MSRFKKTAPQSLNPKAGTQDILSDKLSMELHIDDTNLNVESMNQPLLYRKWSQLKAQIGKKVKILKLQLGRLEGQKYLEFGKMGGKVREIESMINSDPEIITLQDQLAEAEALLEEYEGIVRAFWQRNESLKDLHANLRKDLL